MTVSRSRPVVTICGLGPGAEDLLTERTAEIIGRPGPKFLRTARHPTAHRVVGARSFDDVYETAASFDDVYRRIGETLVAAATAEGRVTYCVPGSPLVLERTVRQLRARDDVAVELVPAISFLDEVWDRLGVDPVDDGVRLVDGHRFVTEAADQRGPLLIAHAHAQWVLSDIKLAVDDGDDTVVVLQRLGTADERVFEVTWADLDRRVDADHLTTLYVPKLSAPVGAALTGTVELMRRLRAECPWDQAQDHASLRRHLLEEAHEVLDALDRLAAADGSGDGDNGHESRRLDAYEELESELGDLWFQILFHAQLAAEAGQFDISDVARGLTDKMVIRHPHVFGTVEPNLHSRAPSGPESTGDGPDRIGSELCTSADVERQWDAIKAVQSPRKSVLDGVPLAMPALALASKVLRRAVADWGPPALSHSVDGLADTVEADTLGSLLLAAVEIGRRLGVDPEVALRETTKDLARMIDDPLSGHDRPATAPAGVSWVVG